MYNKKLEEIKNTIAERNNNTLSPYACRSDQAHRREELKRDEFRSPFAVDRDRILYSGAYRRYHGKTQVFSFTNMIDEEMTNRNLHTTYVSQISRTIGRVLGLNLDLIEAIALGHDLGHCPFGHDGERALSKICRKKGIGAFHHNVESLHIVDNISRKGKGLNLTFQVRDGIISHDGEVHNTQLIPQFDKTETDIEEYIKKKHDNKNASWMPATMEGCTVRIADTIAYIGQDIEDAIRCNLLSREALPKEVTDYLGSTNSRIINTLVESVIMNSFGQEYIAFDEKTSKYLLDLKHFNYKHIYKNPLVKKANTMIERTMNILFDKYLDDISNGNTESKIYQHFLVHKDKRYLDRFTDVEKVRDFIATMTDRYFNEEIKDYLVPWKY